MKTLIYIILIVGVILIALQLFNKNEVTAPSDSENVEFLSGTVTGTVNYLPRIALPEGSIINIALLQEGDANLATVSSTEIVTKGENVPVPFALDYFVDDLDENAGYYIKASIYSDGGVLDWEGDSGNVITKGNPVDGVEIMVSQVPAPETASETNGQAPEATEGEITSAVE
ncbi:MAG: YbaY family lipoprotein [Candidatus Pacebacteria bacterium]|nr:YbaY family lipoprotein [Candidatus Paceibacterota bacterium]